MGALLGTGSISLLHSVSFASETLHHQTEADCSTKYTFSKFLFIIATQSLDSRFYRLSYDLIHHPQFLARVAFRSSYELEYFYLDFLSSYSPRIE